MSERYTLEQIRDFWTQQAVEHGQAPSASWSDQPVIDMEVREITKRLADGDRVLDVGCANGYTTLQFVAAKAVTIRGLDLIPEMVEQAKARLSAATDKMVGAITFGVGDITALNEPDDTYDKVVVVRVVINLVEWSRQLRALRECLRVLKPGGTLVLSEATVQGWQKMNAFRAEWGMGPIPMPAFNFYLDEDRVVQSLAAEAELVEIANFASSYFVGTRVIKPLLARVVDGIDVANPNMEWNKWCAQLPAVGDYGTQKLFVFRKK